jgi:acetylornithine deacetylase/succinyl-diaminopimelate desuccinylase-like protein
VSDRSAGPAITDTDEVARLAADLIRIDTTNRGGGECRERPAAEYVAERLTEAGLSAQVLESAPGRANVVARVTGTEPDRPALLVHGHLDVVPADPREWAVPPFAGEVRDGEVWGRGAVDMKGSIAMVLAVLGGWARAARTPRRDIVFAFTADEEDTAEYGARFLVQRHADLFEGCSEAIGESGGYTVDAGSGVRVYPVAAAERGTAWLRLTAHGRAGHGSRHNRENAVTRLAAAVARIGAYEWPARLTPAVRAAVEGLSAAMGSEFDPQDPERHAVALAARPGQAAGLIASTMRNSANPTMLAAGYKVNVIPGQAQASVDGRVLPGLAAEFEATIDRLVGPDVRWEYQHREPPLSAPLDSPTFAAMRDALLAADPDAHVVPYCMAGGTDAKQFSRLGVVGYGFMPLRLPTGYEYHAMFHGVDERVPLAGLDFGVQVLDRFLTSC